MLTASYIGTIANKAGNTVADLQDEIIARIIARFTERFIRNGKITFTQSDRWDIQSLEQSGLLFTDVKKIIAKYTGRTLREINDALKHAGIKSAQYDAKIYADAGIAYNPMSPEVTRIIARNYEKTAGLWRNFTATTAAQSETLFKQICDDAYMSVVLGNKSSQQAIIEGINVLANSKIGTVQYPTGHTDTIETAVTRAVRTACVQTASQITAQRANDFGIECFVVSSHMGARPEHAKWQGKVYWIDWERLKGIIPFSTFVPVEASEEVKAKYSEFVESTGIGTVTGLSGVNCRHSFMPWIEGVSHNPFEQIDEKENEKAYQLSQRQRSLERGIRKSKLEMNGLEQAAGTTNDPQVRAAYDAALNKVRSQVERYYSFCEENGLKPNQMRLEVGKR